MIIVIIIVIIVIIIIIIIVIIVIIIVIIIIIVVEVDWEPAGKFDFRTLSSETLSRWTGRTVSFQNFIFVFAA